MIDRTLFSETPLPEPPAGWFDYGYRVLMDGRLALIRTRTDVHSFWREQLEGEKATSPLYSIPHPPVWAADAEWTDWYRAVQAGFAARPRIDSRLGHVPNENEIRLSIFDGAQEAEPIVVPHGHHALVDRTAGGQWLVVPRALNSRAWAQRGGALYASDGQQVGSLPLGDGIQALLCSPDGTIWAGYGDEAIYDPPDGNGGPPSRGGLVRFDASGQPVWAFNQDAEADDDSLRVRDCPAMTLTGSTLWALLPNWRSNTEATPSVLVGIQNGRRSLFGCSLDDGRELAVAGSTLLVAGMRHEAGNRIAAGAIGKTEVRGLGRVRVEAVARAVATAPRWPHHLIHYIYEFDQDDFPGPRLLQGRDGVLHAVSRGVWLRFDAAGVARASDPDDTPPICIAPAGGWAVYPHPPTTLRDEPIRS